MTLKLPEKISSKRIYLERLRYEFAEEIFYSYASKPEVTRYVAWPTHRSITDTRGYLSYAVPAWNSGTDFTYAIRLIGSNRIIGSIGCLNDVGKIQFGYVLGPVFWNQGYATEACLAILPHLKSSRDIYRIWTLTDVENVASQKVLVKCGLVEEARVARWIRFVNQDNSPRDCIFFKVPDEFLASRLVTQ
jgi:[ribosomal protein S5]-alanine N-acetyltransferase